MEVLDYLDKFSARYEVMDHRPTFTAQQMAAEEHIPGIHVAKPVMVKSGGQYYMCVLPACYKIDLEQLRQQLGVDQIELAEEDELAKLFPDCSLGAEPPVGIFYGFLTLLDKKLDEQDYIVFQAGTHERSIKMEMAEYKRVARPRVFSFSHSV